MADIMVYNALGEANRAIRVAMGDVTDRQQILSDPDYATLWPDVLPALESVAGTLCVYDSTSGYFRDGGCCLWTVPAGATKVRFELWGAGAGSGAGLCCGGSPPGPTGAYATMTIDAVPGCQYTLCAGAANSCLSYCTGCQDISGCQSYVTGYDLTGFCADGGCSSLCRNMGIIHGQTCCRYQAPGRTNSGPCICGGNYTIWYCYDNSCATCGIVPRVADPDRIGRGTSSTGTLYYIPSIYASMCLDTDHYGCWCSTPTILPNGALSTICCSGFSSGTCCGADKLGACKGCFVFPGQGGMYTHVMGGNTGLYGDWGRTGMVKVSWC